MLEALSWFAFLCRSATRSCPTCGPWLVMMLIIIMMICDSLSGDDDADMIMIMMICDSLVGDDDAVADDSVIRDSLVVAFV